MTANSPAATVRLPLLDGMRGVAAAMVVFYHDEEFYSPDGIWRCSFLAVDFFLMLSGFVLARRYDRMFLNGLGAREFLNLRLRRLYPLMAFATALGSLQYYLNNETYDVIILAAYALAFIPQFSAPGGIFPLNGPQWSLLFELLLNFAHAIGLWKLSNQTVSLVIAVCAVIVPIAAIHYLTFSLGMTRTGFWVGFPRAGLSYGIGMLLARKSVNWPNRHSTMWALPLILLPASLLLLGNLSRMAGFIGSGITPLAIFPPVMIIAIRFAPPAWIEPALNWAGRVSFPLYAIHLPLMLMVKDWVQLHPDLELAGRIAGPIIAFATATLLAETPLSGTPRRRPVQQAALA